MCLYWTLGPGTDSWGGFMQHRHWPALCRPNSFPGPHVALLLEAIQQSMKHLPL